MSAYSHNQYCVTQNNRHNIWYVTSEAVAFAVLVAGIYSVASLGAVLDAIVAGGQ